MEILKIYFICIKNYSITGVSHGDDIPYLFNTRKLDLRKTGNDNDKRKSKEMIKMWTNFAKGL